MCKEYSAFKVPARAQKANTMGPFKLSSNKLIPELGISLQLACVQYRNVIAVH